MFIWTYDFSSLLRVSLCSTTRMSTANKTTGKPIVSVVPADHRDGGHWVDAQEREPSVRFSFCCLWDFGYRPFTVLPFAARIFTACKLSPCCLLHPQITEMEAILSARNNETKELKVNHRGEVATALFTDQYPRYTRKTKRFTVFATSNQFCSSWLLLILLVK